MQLLEFVAWAGGGEALCVTRAAQATGSHACVTPGASRDASAPKSMGAFDLRVRRTEFAEMADFVQSATQGRCRHTGKCNAAVGCQGRRIE